MLKTGENIAEKVLYIIEENLEKIRSEIDRWITKTIRWLTAGKLRSRNNSKENNPKVKCPYSNILLSSTKLFHLV